jgi:hypothetical protein
MNIDNQIVGIHFGAPTLPVVSEIYPRDNWIGAALLRRLLELTLLRAELIGEDMESCAGPLNDCVLFFHVLEQTAAVEAIKAELIRLRMLPYCQIAIPDGANWRCVHPSHNTRMEWLLDIERHEAYAEQREQLSAERRALIDSLLRKIHEAGEKGGGKK